MPKGIPLTPEEQAHRRREIFDTTLNLILAKGFQETSMREIAEAAGMGKSSLYDYFKTKDEILVFVLEEETQMLTDKAREIAALDLPPDQRLRQVMAMHMAFMQENANLFAILTVEAQRLKLASQKRIQERRYAYQNLVKEIIEQGIAQGCFREVNPLLAARLLITSLVSILYTTRPTGSAEDMLDDALTIFLDGIKI
jgi:TetR/AcrR family transcriptional regulator, cholesterol catabolism regulator